MTEEGKVRQPRSGLRFRKVYPTIRFDVAKAKAAFLRYYRRTGEFRQCCERIGRDSSRVYTWLREDDEFRDEFEERRAVWLQVLDGRFDSMEARALDAFDEALDKEQNPNLPLRVQVADKVLKGRGHLSERSRVELTGQDGQPVRIATIEVAQPEPVEGQVRVIKGPDDDDVEA